MWLYDGLPEHIGLSVRDASPLEGGYVVVFELDTGEVRMLATRFPAKYVASWKSNARRYGGGELRRVLVSKPHPRYERLKRMLTEMLADDAADGDAAPLSIALVLEKAHTLFPAKPSKQLGDKSFLQGLTNTNTSAFAAVKAGG